MEIVLIEELAESIKEDYKTQANITMRWLQDYRKEVKAFKEYRGREVFELLQNADDAESDTVEISIDSENNELKITNSGKDTKLFTYAGLKSIMLSDISPKAGTAMIGKMGLGFRSVLNWTDEIRIESDNMSAQFSSTIAEEYWNELKASIQDAPKYEAEAKRNGSKVPLAILALPKIETISPSNEKSTSIILRYDEAKVEESILNNLKTFRPEFMLFLKHVTKIVIKISGEPDRVLLKEKLSEESGIITYKINNHTWAVSLEHTSMGQSTCETACAFCLDEQQDSYSIYTYFPTKVDFPFPCILHASLELDSSRNSLLPDNQVNREVISRLTARIGAVADYLKNIKHGWYPYKMMRPDANHKNEYVQQLVKEVRALSESGEYVPTFDGGWASENDCYYYSDDMFSFIEGDVEAKRIFPKLRLPGAPEYVTLNAVDLNAVENVNAYFRHIAKSRDEDRLVQAVTLLYACKPCHGHCFNVLPDDQFTIIDVSKDSPAYINTGQAVSGIPDFRKIKYVHKGLVEKLLKAFDMPGDHKDRILAQYLQNITHVSATDITSVTTRLLPKQADVSLQPGEKEELLSCLFRLFLDRGKTIDQETLKHYKPYLTSETGAWCEASTLVFLDEKFPSGFRKLKGMDGVYGEHDGVAFPEFLLGIEDAAEADIEEFYVSLGVCRYLRSQSKFFGDDYDYLRELTDLPDTKLPQEFINNCDKDRVVKEGCNMALVADADCFKSLSLNQALDLISLSGYRSHVIGDQSVYWFKNRLYHEKVSLSYAAYCLKRVPCFAELKNYVIDDNCWLPGCKNDPLDVGTEYSDKEMLRALGAKMNFSEFDAKELYDAINKVTALFENGEINENEVLEHYLALIKALDAKKATPSSENVTLRLVCRKDDRYEVLESAQVYYSDNNEFPLEVRKTLPMLLMRRRQGEQKISNVLGCKTLKQIKVSVDKKTDNENLTRDLARRLDERKAYFLAFASVNVGKRGGKTNVLFNEEYRNRIADFNVTVLYGVICRYGQNPVQMKMNDEGELLVVDSIYHVCSDATSLEYAMRNPRFNSSLIEALCLQLNLQGFELADKFYRIFTSDLKELEYYRKQEIDDALWQECQRQFGYTDEDVEFWSKVFGLRNLSFDSDQLKKDKALYIASQLGMRMQLDRFLSVSKFKEYHMMKLRESRERFKLQYLHSVYVELVDHFERHKEYHVRQMKYNVDGWLEGLLDVDDNKYHLELDYDRLVCEAISDQFECDVTEHKAIEHKPLPCYEDIERFHLSDDDKGLIYFDGHLEYLRKSYQDDDDEKQSIDVALDTIPQICSIQESSISKPHLSHAVEVSDRPHVAKGRAKVSEKRKRQLGNQAEDAVYAALQASKDYRIIRVYSSHLADTDLGDDSKGYDLEYIKEGETLSRFLEIKHSKGDSIILSANEYKVATSPEYRDRYDIALYYNGNVTIVRTPFIDNQKFEIQANDYTVRFEID